MELLTVAELAKMLKLRGGTIYTWCSRGLIPHVKVGGAVRFRENDIETWLVKKAELIAEAKKIETMPRKKTVKPARKKAA